MNWSKRLRAALIIPLGAAGWQPLNFSKIPANQVGFTEKGIEIRVEHSAGALIRKFDKTETVSHIHAELEIRGEIPAAAAFPEDAYLRVGLVVPGTRKPNAIERLFAPAWIKQLFKLAPKDSGIDKIEFYNLEPVTGRIGQNRIFPKSKDLIRETIAAERPPSAAQVHFDYDLPKPLEAAALWLSVDGDDTKSQYTLIIKALELRSP
jgi:hypothetical protein